MKKGLLFFSSLLFMLLLSSAGVYAQTTVTGVVTDENGDPFPGVTVRIEGTSNGTATDVNGAYSIEVTDGKTLVFSAVGYATQARTVNGDSQLDLQMPTSANELGEVIVTGLGLEAERDKQGGSYADVNAKSVVSSGETGLINGMKGKVAGINITQNTGDPGAGSKIIIRGQSSITGSNEPLIVVDGVPVSNESFSGDGSSTTDGVAQQNRMNDINPNDIASIQVLKGASAAAIWGSRGANGVIMITTKKGSGKGGKNFSVDYSVSLAFDKINKKVPLQFAYGAGNNGRFEFTPGGGRSWGDPIGARSGAADVASTTGAFFTDGQAYVFPIANGTAGTTRNGGKNDQATYDPFNYLFKTGTTITNSLNISSGDEKGSIYVSLADTRQDGIIKSNSNYRRTNVRLNITRNLGKIFTVSANGAYTKTYSDRIQQGSNLNGLFLGGLRQPADYNPYPYTGTYYDATGTGFESRQRAYRNPLGANTNSIYDSPLWSINNNASNTEVDRFTGKLEFTADPLSWLNLIGRAGYDTYSDVRNDYFPSIASGNNNGGRFVRQTINSSQLQLDFIARGTYNIGDFLKGNVLLGTSFNERRISNVSTTTRNFVNPLSPPQLGNSTSGNFFPNNSTSILRTQSFYGAAGVEIKDGLVSVNGTIRTDVFSTLAGTSNNGVVYGGADIAFQFSKLIPENDIFTFGKLRASYGTIGRADNTQYNTLTYTSTYNTAEGYGPALSGAGYGGAYGVNSTAGNPNLKPELKTEFELGLDLRFLKDRLSVTGTYYQNTVNNAILVLPLANATGFSNQVANAAKISNKGFELDITGEILKFEKFSWTTNLNYTRNINNVDELAPGTTNLFLAGFSGSASYAVVGSQIGTLWGSRWDRSSDGSLNLDANGFPKQAATEGVLADPNPEFRYGIGNTFTYTTGDFGKLSLNVLFEGSYGGKMWNGTKGALYFFGRHEDTGITTTVSAADAAAIKNYNGQTIAVAYPQYKNSDGTYTVRGDIRQFNAGSQRVFVDESFYRVGPGSGFTGPTEQFIEDASWFRLRELTLGYTFNSEGFKNLTKLQSISLNLTGRNMFLWTQYSGIDPDTNLSGSAAGQNGLGIDYFNNPATKSFIMTLKITY